jgi:ABC-type glycerol-3-phosphate transport system substrate-binding protein
MPKQLPFVLTLLVLSLASCSPATSEPYSPLESPVPTSPASTEPGPTVDPSHVGSIDLQLWLPVELSPAGKTPGAEILAQQLADFAAGYTSLSVKVTEKNAQGEGDLLSFLLAAKDAAPSVLPDLAILDSAHLTAAQEAGLLQPVGELLPEDRLEDQFPFAVEMTTVGDTQVGFVLGAQILHAAYRPDLVATAPVSWTQVVSNRIRFLFPAAGQNGLVDDATLIQYLAATDRPLPAEGGPVLDGDALEAVLGFYGDAVTRGAVSAAAVLAIGSPDEAWERFLAGESSLSTVRSSRYWREADETMIPAQLPTRDGSPATVADGWVIVLVTQSPERQAAALALIDALTAPEPSADWTRAGGFLPATREGLALWSDSADAVAALRPLMESARPRPELPASTSQAIQAALESVLRGQATARQATAAALEAVDQ